MQTALITGASAGIGVTFARKLAARGYHVVLVARRADRLEALAHELGNAEALAADVTDSAALDRIAARARGVDLLVNNAGFGTRGYFWEADLGEQERMYQTHVMAIVRLSHAALAGMTARGSGAVINVSSVAGFGTSPGNVSYCSTKTWINAFTEGLALELRARQSPVRVQALCPGFTYSEFHDVLGMDRSKISKNWWLTSEYVVEESLRGLERGELFVVPSTRYKLLVWLQKLAPRSLMHAGAIRYARRTGRG